MQIDPAALAASIGELHHLDLDRGLTTTLQQVVTAATTLFGADGAGLMLADASGELRWASASDQQAQLVEEDQERLGMGPCRAAFSQRMAITVRNAGTEPDPDGSRLVLRSAGFQAGMSVPIELHGGPIGSLDLYSAQPRNWDDSEVSALQAYAGIVANLLRQRRRSSPQRSTGRPAPGGPCSPRPHRAGQRRADGTRRRGRRDRL
jgi:GAF domain-containing protein